MEDLIKKNIEKFLFTGSIFIWKYNENTRNYPGWNITLNKSGCSSLIELLDIMSQSKWQVNKVVSLTIPSETIINIPHNKTAKWITKSKIIFCYKKNNVSNFWELDYDEDIIKINFGREKLNELKTSIKKLSIGIGDFAMADNSDDNILYFWGFL